MLPVALTVAGSDSSGGAGIQADLRTFAALGVFGTSALTAVTAQNTLGVTAVAPVPPHVIAAQIHAVLTDMPVRAIKTGMLADVDTVRAVVTALATIRVPLVVDPVCVAKSGHALLTDDAIGVVRSLLLPHATLVTPNLPEAERLVGFRVQTVEDQERAARALVALGARAALVKGGHGTATELTDVLFDGSAMHHLSATRIHTRHTHGTGCTYAAAVAAFLARALPLQAAVERAHAYVRAAIAAAPGLGSGHGPLHHMHPWYPRTGLP